MKQYISKLLMAVVAVWGLASCTDTDMPALTTYDAQESLGTWVSENTDDGTTYYVALSLKKTVVPAAEDGAQPTVKVDTVGTLYMTDGTDTYVAANGTLSYDAKVGMSTLDFANTPFRYPMHVYLARQTSKTRMSVQLFIYEVYQGKVYEQKLVAFNGIPSKGVAIAGENLFWGNADGTFYIQFNADGTCAYQTEAVPEGTGTYTYDAATGTGSVTLADGTTYTIGYNADNALTLTNGTTTMVMSCE